MKYVQILARAAAAVTVAGAAITGTAIAAGAATTPLSGDVTSSPIISFGPGTTQPAPGADATVPLHSTAQGSADSPASSPVSQVPVKSGDRVATGSAPADACVGAAAFSGHDDGCSAQNAGSSPQPSGPTGSTGGLGSNMLGNPVGLGSICAEMTSLGLAGLLPCDAIGANPANGISNGAGRQLGSASAGGPTAVNGIGNAANRQLGGASAGGPTGIGGDGSGATPAGPSASGSASAGAGGASGQGSATTGPASTRFNAACASNSHAAGGGSSPGTAEKAGLLGALTIAGLAFRRTRRPRLA
jgi:MYXO-CTERM domain-containing protein